MVLKDRRKLLKGRKLKGKQRCARMAKLADAADLKSADLYRSWGFKSPSGHHRINILQENTSIGYVRKISAGAAFGATLFQLC